MKINDKQVHAIPLTERSILDVNSKSLQISTPQGPANLTCYKSKITPQGSYLNLAICIIKLKTSVHSSKNNIKQSAIKPRDKETI